MIESRYVYRGNAVGIGGRITRIDPNPNLNILIPVQGASSLPTGGGRSESKLRKCEYHVKKPKGMKLVTVGSVATLAETDVERPGSPFVTRVYSEVRSVKILDSISVSRVVLNLKSTHRRGENATRITPENSEITGLKLGKFPIKVELDLGTFQQHDTKESLNAAFRRSPAFRKSKARKFNTDPKAETIREFRGGYYIGTLVESISGGLPEGAYIDENGYTIVWPGVGQIVLGEILIAENSRRVTMVRVELGSPIAGRLEMVEGDVNGGDLP